MVIFQFTSKKIISLLACISITISCLVIPASAAVTPGQVIEGIGTITTLWDIGKDAYEMWQELNPDKDPSEYSGFNPGGSFSGIGGSRDDAIARYDTYVNDLQTDLGSTSLNPSRIYYEWPVYLIDIRDTSALISSSVGYSWSFQATTQYGSVGVQYDTGNGTNVYTPPVAGGTLYLWSRVLDYQGCILSTTSNYVDENGCDHYFSSSGSWTVPGTFFDRSGSSGYFVSGLACYGYYQLPAGMTVQSLLESVDVSTESRPTVLTGDYGIIGDDGTIIKYDSTKIVDETNSLVWNPVTDTSVNFTEWSYDYSDRSYNLTLEDGSTMKVVYGDENVTIEEGDTVYNVYYLTSGSEDGSGGSGDTGDDGSGGIGGAIGGLFDVLGEIIYSLIEGLINLATKALSALTGLLDLLKQFAESIIGFFGGYTDFLAAAFPFLPEETFTILNLGLILLIAAAVFKKFL